MDKNYFMDLAKILICPKTKKQLTYDPENQLFINTEENICYRIEDGIPLMLEEEAEAIKNQD